MSLNVDSIKTIDSSKIADYLTCPRMFFFRHILGWQREGTNLHLSFGSLWHEAMEYLLLNGYTVQNVEQAMQSFEQAYFNLFTEEQALTNGQKTPAEARTMLLRYIEQFPNDLVQNKVEATELGGVIPLNENSSIAFKMDSILLTKDGSAVFSLEHKTASREMNTWFEEWNSRFQLFTYYYVLTALYPEIQNRSIIVNVGLFRKTNPEFKRLRIVKTKDQMLSWFWTVNTILLSIQHELEQYRQTSYEQKPILTVFPMNVQNCIQYASKCKYFDLCHTWANPIKVFGTNPPEGFHTEYWNPLDEVKTNLTYKLKG